MKPVEFAEQNIILKEPEGWSKDDCGTMGAYANPEGSMGTGEIVSCWELTDAEIEEIKKTKKVWLMIMSKTMCPTTLTVENPFIKPEEINTEPVQSIDEE